MPDFSIEKEVKSGGYKYVCGVDEAGRGPLAGPVSAAAVILPDDIVIEGLNDSKKISEKKREILFDIIKEKAISYSIAFASIEEIEEHNILNATFLAMSRAINGLDVKTDFALIDGNRVPSGISVPCKTVVKGDSLSCSIAAASILANVSRDRYMCSLDSSYDVYNFKKHKGYGTKEHTDLIKKYGPSDIHRLSFLKNIL